jgi:hypothetical protein
VQVRAAVAAQKTGVLSEEYWKKIKDVAASVVVEPLRYSTYNDRQSERLLTIALARKDTILASKILKNVITWASNRVLRLWRLTPYLQVRSPSSPVCAAQCPQTDTSST